MILIDRHGSVAVVALDQSVTNPLTQDLLDKLSDSLDDLREDESVRAVVLTSSSEKFFSIGFNIPQLIDLPRSTFETFYRTFNRLCLDLYAFPKPTVAALKGHAIAGGCILALCCDYRCIAEGRKLMGVNEIKLGVPVPYPADCILRQLVGDRTARDMMESGEFFATDELLRFGVVDRSVPADRVLSESVEQADALGAMPTAAFAVIKRNRVERVEATIRAHLEEKEQLFMDCWYSDEARALLREAVKKF
jgi:enoyl-CoA hydratase/carnithine racemase